MSIASKFFRLLVRRNDETDVPETNKISRELGTVMGVWQVFRIGGLPVESNNNSSSGTVIRGRSRE